MPGRFGATRWPDQLTTVGSRKRRGMTPSRQPNPPFADAQGDRTWRDSGDARQHQARDFNLKRPLRWHDLRHTFVSWALQGGVTLHELMQFCGCEQDRQWW
jgi:hypothetical protein